MKNMRGFWGAFFLCTSAFGATILTPSPFGQYPSIASVFTDDSCILMSTDSMLYLNTWSSGDTVTQAALNTEHILSKTVFSAYGRHEAIGKDGLIYTSTDLLHWNLCPIDGISGIVTLIDSVGDGLVGIGKAGAVFFSDSGTEWKRCQCPVSGNLSTIIPLADRWFVITEDSSEIAVTDNGHSWEKLALGDSLCIVNITRSESALVIVDTLRIFSSSNGVTWETFHVDSLQRIVGVATYDSLMVVLCYSNGVDSLFPILLSSTNGRSWKTHEYPSIVPGPDPRPFWRASNIVPIYHCRNVWVGGIAYKQSFMVETQTKYWLFSSKLNYVNDVGWSWRQTVVPDIVNKYSFQTPRYFSAISSDTGVVSCAFQSVLHPDNTVSNYPVVMRAVTVHQDTIIAVGDKGTTSRSTDGLNWISSSGVVSANLYCVASSGTIVVAGGERGTLISSSDGGATWTKRTSGTSQTLRAATWFNGRFVLGGDSGVIVTSSSGTGGWRIRVTESVQPIVSFAANDSILLAMAKGPDILTWDLKFAASLLSNDGIYWSARNFGTLNSADSSFYSVVWTGKYFAALGGSLATDTFLCERVYVSADGVRWDSVYAKSFDSHSAGTYPPKWYSSDSALQIVAVDDSTVAILHAWGALEKISLVPFMTPIVMQPSVAHRLAVRQYNRMLVVTADFAAGSDFTDVELLDLKGRVLERVSAGRQDRSVVLPLDGIASGSFILRVSGGSMGLVKPIMVVR